MTINASYGQFCPVAMAAEIICTRWTPLVLRELLAGSTRFNQLRKGLPLMSPALLSKRLRELEEAGLIRRSLGDDTKVQEYRLTEAGEELKPLILGLGFWGQRWVESQVSLKNLDPSLLMWDMRRHLDPTPLPERRCTIQFLYPEVAAPRQKWWLVIDRGEVDLCGVDPGFPVDLYVQTDVRTMTAVWMGMTTLREEFEAGRVQLDGRAELKRSMQQWLGLSPFATERPRVGSYTPANAAA